MSFCQTTLVVFSDNLILTFLWIAVMRMTFWKAYIVLLLSFWRQKSRSYAWNHRSFEASLAAAYNALNQRLSTRNILQKARTLNWKLNFREFILSLLLIISRSSSLICNWLLCARLTNGIRICSASHSWNTSIWWRHQLNILIHVVNKIIIFSQNDAEGKLCTFAEFTFDSNHAIEALYYVFRNN